MRSDLNGQLDLMLDEDAVEYKPKRGCLKTGLVKRLDQQTAPQKISIFYNPRPSQKTNP